MIQRRTGFGLARAALFILLCLAGTAIAEPVAVNIPAQSLDSALTALGAQARLTIVADPALVRGRTAPAVSGTMEPAAALDALLKGSGLAATIRNGTATVRKAPGPGEPESRLPEVSVTGATATAAMPGDTPAPYAGGQVARGAQAGLLGNRDYMETPFSITSYTAQTAQDQQARTLADVMANDPSVRNFYSQSFPQDSFYIRGFQVDSADFAMQGLYGTAPLLRTSPAMLERVEVLKGPSALLNGMPPFGGIGGVVNLVPKRAGDEPVTQLTASYASDAQFGGHVDVGRRFGTDNSVGIRFNGVYRDGDTALEDNRQQFGQAALALDFRGESVRITLDLGYQQAREDGTENALFPDPGAVPGPPDASKRYFQPWLYNDNHDLYGTLRGEVDLTQDITAYAAVGGRRHRFEELYAVGFPLQANGNFDESFGHDASTSDTFTAQAGVRAKFSTGSVRHDVSASATTLRQDRALFFDGSLPLNPSNLYAPNFIARPGVAPLPGDLPKLSEAELNSYALADTVSFMQERLIVILGARLQQVKQDNFDIGTGARVSRYDEEAVTPALGVVYRVSNPVSIYASYIEGLSQGPEAPAGTANAGQVFAPTKSKQVEGGVKLDLGRAGATLAVFQIEQPNGITDPATNLFGPDGEQRNRGVELSAFGQVSRSVRLLGGAMYLDGVLAKTQGGIDEGNTALNAPEWNVNLGAEWDTPFAAGLTLNARVIYTSSQYVDQANTQQIPSWTRVDVGGRYATKAGGRPLVLRAGIENLLDKAYWYNSSLFRGAPRTFLVSATVDF